MTTRIGLVLLLLLALLVAACGGSASPAPSSEPGTSSEPAASEPAASVEPSSDGGGGGGGGVGLPSGFRERLVPPDSTVVASISVEEGSSVTFVSDASVEELVDFYEAAFRDLGIEPGGKVETPDGVWWAFEEGALITVGADTSGQGQTFVSITAAETIGG